MNTKIKLKERLTNHMYPKDKSESYLINNCLSGTMSLGANLLSIFVPSYFLTVTKVSKRSDVDSHEIIVNLANDYQ